MRGYAPIKPRVFAYKSSSKSIVFKYIPSSEDLSSVVEVAVDVAALCSDSVESGVEQVLLASEDADGPVVVLEAVLHGAGLAVADFGAAEVEVGSLGAPLERLAAQVVALPHGLPLSLGSVHGRLVVLLGPVRLVRVILVLVGPLSHLLIIINTLNLLHKVK